MGSVDGFVHAAHIVCGDFVCERVECCLYLRPSLQGFFADKGNGFIRRKVVLVVAKHGEA